MTVRRRLARMATVSLACAALVSAWPTPAGADPRTGVTVTPTAKPAYPADAPDPDVVVDGSTSFAFSTGTSLASYL
ncbi:MAG TPA: hypothetical protein VF279_07770, partial [Acidimicrobiales bacterium]